MTPQDILDWLLLEVSESQDAVFLENAGRRLRGLAILAEERAVQLIGVKAYIMPDASTRVQ